MRSTYLLITLFALLASSCGGQKETKTTESTEEKTAPKVEPKEEESSIVDLSNKGIGPITTVTLGELDQEMANKGKEIFESYCVACHKAEESFIGPAPKGILDRRSPEWVLNMILNPEEMTAKDPIAIKLLEEANGVPMIGQGITEEQARQLLEYFRTI